MNHKPTTFNSFKWYRASMELIGKIVLASCDGITVYGSHDKFGLPKTSVAPGTRYCVRDFRRFRIYESTPNPGWTPPQPCRKLESWLVLWSGMGELHHHFVSGSRTAAGLEDNSLNKTASYSSSPVIP